MLKSGQWEQDPETGANPKKPPPPYEKGLNKIKNYFEKYFLLLLFEGQVGKGETIFLFHLASITWAVMHSLVVNVITGQ